MNEYHVYILRCRDGSLYTGVTNDYQTRLWQHQSGLDPHCYTFKRRPVELVYVGIFGDINEAISWEKKVKRWSRAKKEALIRREFEVLPMLAQCENGTHFKHYNAIACHGERSRTMARDLLSIPRRSLSRAQTRDSG